jgi:hypothetical protein
MDDVLMPALIELIEDEEVLTYVTPTINKLWSKDVSSYPANARAGVAQFKNPTVDMSESATLRTIRYYFWVAILATCGLVLYLYSNFDTWYDPYSQNCIMSLTYPGPPEIEFEDFSSGIAKLWIDSMKLDY